MKLLLHYLKRYWKTIVIALLLASINQVFSLLDPLVFKMIIDRYATNYKGHTSTEFFNGIIKLLLAAIGVAMVSRIAKNFQDYYVNVITQKLGTKLYSDGIEHSMKLPYASFEDQQSGKTLGVLQKVRSDAERFISSFINIVFSSLVGIIFVTVYAVTVHWTIAPIYLATIPILGFISSMLSKKIKQVQKVIVAETTSLAGSTTESLRNIELVKSLGLAEQEIGRLNKNTHSILKLELKKVKYIRTLSFIQGTCVNLLRNCILFLLLFLIFKEKITLGQFFSLYIYSFAIFNPLQELGNIINTYRETEVSVQNFQKLLQTPIEPKPENPIYLTDIRELAFSQVSYKHSSSHFHALQQVSFKMKKGETIAFVGPSGSGKTTLVKLLVGLYQPQQGTIYYNEATHSTIDLNFFRKQIGFVTQETHLFSGTIRENLLFVQPQATDHECLEALEKASCQNLLARANKGLDTLIGEGGIKISGGEKQRLSIARALLRNPSLLVFDEATSSLDSLTEDDITQTISKLSSEANLMIILIAHRLSTILHADRIFVLEKGQIIEQGKHHDLLEQKGLYYAMWRQQIGER